MPDWVTREQIDELTCTVPDGRYLRISFQLQLAETDKGVRLKVVTSSFQYQEDNEGNHWIFRYDYLRNSANEHPSAHFHVRGTLQEEGVLSGSQQLERIHFPSSRVTLEAVIRLLATQFAVPCNTGDDVWRPVLAESEHLFLKIAHQPLSGRE